VEIGFRELPEAFKQRWRASKEGQHHATDVRRQVEQLAQCGGSGLKPVYVPLARGAMRAGVHARVVVVVVVVVVVGRTCHQLQEKGPEQLCDGLRKDRR